MLLGWGMGVSIRVGRPSTHPLTNTPTKPHKKNHSGTWPGCGSRGPRASAASAPPPSTRGSSRTCRCVGRQPPVIVKVMMMSDPISIPPPAGRPHKHPPTYTHNPTSTSMSTQVADPAPRPNTMDDLAVGEALELLVQRPYPPSSPYPASTPGGGGTTSLLSLFKGAGAGGGNGAGNGNGRGSGGGGGGR